MKALLLSAGLGTRLRPITNSIPKCLVEIDDIPLLGHWLERLTSAGIESILINLHYMSDQIIDYINGTKYAGQVTTVLEEKLLGTAGTLLKNKAFFQSQSIMLIHADNLSLFNIAEFIDAYKCRGKNIDITMMTFETDDPVSCGIVQLDDNGVVRSFHEKVNDPPGNIANGAVYIVNPSVIDFINEIKKDIIDFSNDVLPNYMGRINTYHNDVYHRDIGTQESLEKARQEYPTVLSDYLGSTQ